MTRAVFTRSSTLSRRDQLIVARDRIATQHGPWTSHCIHLGEDVYTIELGPNWRVEHFARIMKDFGYRTLEGVRILDLACLEGLFSVEFARMGAETVGIEIRTANIEKARFAKNILGLDRCALVQDDVMALSREKYGPFDVVLCAGILYHLYHRDMPDLIKFIQKMSDVAKHLLIIDTHIALETLRENRFALGEMMTEVVDQDEYRGRYFIEHHIDASPDEKQQRLWASANNVKSFWLTRISLHHALRKLGFEQVYEVLQDPGQPIEGVDRLTFVAVK